MGHNRSRNNLHGGDQAVPNMVVTQTDENYNVSNSQSVNEFDKMMDNS